MDYFDNIDDALQRDIAILTEYTKTSAHVGFGAQISAICAPS